jgi:hypothetical protein
MPKKNIETGQPSDELKGSNRAGTFLLRLPGVVGLRPLRDLFSHFHPDMVGDLKFSGKGDGTGQRIADGIRRP